MKPVIETDDWKLGCFLDWQPKWHTEICASCGGSGEIGGGFKDIDGKRQCGDCYGSGRIDKKPSTPKPKIPAELREHMRRAWWDFVNGKSTPTT